MCVETDYSMTKSSGCASETVESVPEPSVCVTEIGGSGRKQGWPASEIGFTVTDQSIFVTKQLCFVKKQCCLSPKQCCSNPKQNCFRGSTASPLIQKDFSATKQTISVTE